MQELEFERVLLLEEKHLASLSNNIWICYKQHVIIFWDIFQPHFTLLKQQIPKSC